MALTRIATVAALLASAISAPVAAQSASALSIANSPAVARANARMEGQNSLEGRGPVFYLIGAAVIGLIIWGAIELLDDDDEAFPVSP